MEIKIKANRAFNLFCFVLFSIRTRMSTMMEHNLNNNKVLCLYSVFLV